MNEEKKYLENAIKQLKEEISIRVEEGNTEGIEDTFINLMEAEDRLFWIVSNEEEEALGEHRDRISKL